MPGGFLEAWRALHPAFRRSLELAYESLVSGGLPVGSALTDPAGAVVAGGRNRAYDPLGGEDPLQGTPLAHAELNTLAVARTDWELAECTLWSTHQPCAMCDAAAAFTGVGQVRYLAPDPWAVAFHGGLDAAPAPTAPTEGPGEPVWAVSANVLFLLGIASRMGVEHPTVAGNLKFDPGPARIVVELVETGQPAEVLTADRPVAAVFGGLWDRIEAAARLR
jgi:tRNA(Arg) A34 adenosine deaminase TadA